VADDWPPNGGEGLEFDHVILAVADLNAAAKLIFEKTGLGSVPGGRHTDMGTANRIIPLGPDYIELMGIVDDHQAAHSPLGRWIARRLAIREGIAAFCLGTESIDAVGRRLRLNPEPMERTTPDGTSLGWRLLGLEAAMADPCRPFFIQWDVPPGMHPGRMTADHRVAPLGISWVDVSGDPHDISSWIGQDSLHVRITPGESGIFGVGVQTNAGELVLR
jgi:hypothetical protein